MSKEFECKIINYQRIRKADMTFIPGLNVIVGETNNGKSSTLRAIETAIYNIPREGHITLGETKSAVGIKYNGHEVIWRRDKEKASQVSYRVDGKIYEKLGRGQPEEVSNALGIRELDINDRKYRLNFSKQMSYPFLLDATPSDMFKFIARSSGEDNLVEVLKQMKKDSSDMSSTIKADEESQKVLGETLVQLEKKLESVKGKEAYCKKILEASFIGEKLDRLTQSVDTYKKCQNAVDKMENSLKYNKNLFNELNTRSSLIESKYKLLEVLDKSLDRIYEYNKALLKYDLELGKSNNALEKYLELDSYKERLSFISISEETHRRLQSSLERYYQYRNNLTALTTTKEVDDDVICHLNTVFPRIEDFLRKFSTTEDQCKAYRDAILTFETSEKELLAKKQMLTEVENSINDIGVCPYCGSVLGGEHDKRRDQEKI